VLDNGSARKNVARGRGLTIIGELISPKPGNTGLGKRRIFPSGQL